MENKESILDQFKNGCLKRGVAHPSSVKAEEYMRSIDTNTLLDIKKNLEVEALWFNEFAAVLHETLRRFLHGEKFSDRYILGLAWFIKDLLQ